MKKLIILMFLIPMFVLGQIEKRQFTELNLGVATIDGYEFSDAFPGASLLYGQTFADNGLVTEYQVGLAAPTILTGKLAIGGGNLDRNIMIACRPWPLTFGPQIKLDWFTTSFEVGFNNGISFDAGLIVTVGFRWQFKGKKKK
jgi:hypothetical protein